MYDILENLLKDHRENIIFKCFSIWHFLFMFIIFGGIITAIILLKNRSQKTKQKVLNIVITSVFALYILDFFLMPFAYGFIEVEKLPFHICTLSCVLCFISRHNKFLSKFRLQFAILGLIGNVCYVLIPAGSEWAQVAPYSYRVIQTLVYHGLMTMYGILAIIYDDNDMNWKHIYKDLIIIIIIVLWALIGNYAYTNETTFRNWFFVVQDPFGAIPLNISRYIMPFIITFFMLLADIIIRFIYFCLKKILKVISNFNK